MEFYRLVTSGETEETEENVFWQFHLIQGISTYPSFSEEKKSIQMQSGTITVTLPTSVFVTLNNRCKRNP